MISPASNPLEPLRRRWIDLEYRYRDAIRDRDVPRGNRCVTSIGKILAEILEQPEGRRIVEGHLSHPLSFMRSSAAIKVMGWAPDLAIPVLGRFMLPGLEPGETPRERIELESTAGYVLCRHFGIDDFDRNRLIEPLLAYGIELPFINRG